MVAERPVGKKIPLESWEVGGELLDILSRGLYTDAKDALREYVQNSVDAHASTIHITIDGTAASVRDDGIGMDFATLRRARRLGASDKGLQFNVGFRGIGIYAAFGMCETLTLQTHQAQDTELHELTLRFGAMNRILQQDRDALERSGVSLDNLLSEHSDFRQTEFTGKPDDQFTIVWLEGLRPEYRAQLSKLDEVHGYLLRVLPVQFPQDGYGTAVNGWMRDLLGLNPVRVILAIGQEPTVGVAPVVAKDVHEPQYAYLEDTDGRTLAFMWYALSTTKGHVATNGASGFLLRDKGFTLGDRLSLKHLWPLVGARVLYHHYTGEVHVLNDADVIPNAARNDLEASLSRNVLFQHLQDKFAMLNGAAGIAQDLLKAREKVLSIQSVTQQVSDSTNDADESPFELYRRSKNLLVEIDRVDTALTRLKTRGRSGRGKATASLSEAQLEIVTNLLAQTKAPKITATKIANSTAKRTGSISQARPLESREAPLPQVSLLKDAVESFPEMADKLPQDRFVATRDVLDEALRLQRVASAVATLDGLKAEEYLLTPAVESSRCQLRSFLGWSPSAPVSLLAALAEVDYLPASERERALIQAVDQGLLDGLGSRGDAYDNLLWAMAAAVANHPDLD